MRIIVCVLLCDVIQLGCMLVTFCTVRFVQWQWRAVDADLKKILVGGFVEWNIRRELYDSRCRWHFFLFTSLYLIHTLTLLSTSLGKMKESELLLIREVYDLG